MGLSLQRNMASVFVVVEMAACLGGAYSPINLEHRPLGSLAMTREVTRGESIISCHITSGEWLK